MEKKIFIDKGKDISEKRSFIIHISTQVETYMNIILMNAFGLKNKKDTKSFGTSAQSLSFNSKINLLYDIEVINLEEYKNLVTLSQIRNQFAHNFYVKDYKDLQKSEGGRQILNYLKKINPKSNTNLIGDIDNIIFNLINDIDKSLLKILAHISMRNLEIVNLKQKSIYLDQLVNLLKSDELVKNIGKENVSHILTLIMDALANSYEDTKNSVLKTDKRVNL